MKLSDFSSPKMRLLSDKLLLLPDWVNPLSSHQPLEIWYEEATKKVYQLNRWIKQYRKADSDFSSYGEWMMLNN